MHMEYKTFLFSVIITISVLSACQSPAEVRIDELTPLEFVKAMGIGYNLGNTMDATGGTRAYKIANFEVAWGAPVTTKEIFEDLKARGFNTIRIPVAWSNLMGSNYEIHPDLINRVEEIVNMVLDSGMFAIVNIHWDGGWITKFSSEYNETLKKYRRIWEQISNRFRNYNEHLIFESMNEEGYFNDLWDRYSGGGDKKLAFDLLNSVNQTFTDIVRKSGGINKARYLLIAGYATDIGATCSPEFSMPKDRAGHTILSVHYYWPPDFAIIDEDANWGKAVSTWGSAAEVERLKKDMNIMKVNFVNKRIPVIIGEYGTVVKNKDPESVRKYIYEVASTIWEMGMCPILWDGSGDVYNRRELAFNDPLIGEGFLKIVKTARQ